MDSIDNGPSSSLKKIEANRRNARLSTGPKTDRGKDHSRRNAVKHGILASALLVVKGEGAEDRAEFDELLRALRQDCSPVGALEELLVERIATSWWRQKRALQCEAALVERSFVRIPPSPPDPLLEEMRKSFEFQPKKPVPELEAIKAHMRLPLGDSLDRILRYETTIQRQLVHSINELERLQRIRKGEHVPAPVKVQLSSDH